MVSKIAKQLLAEIFSVKKICRGAEEYLLALLENVRDRKNHDDDLRIIFRLLYDETLGRIREINREKRQLAKTQPKKMPRAKKKPGIRVTIEKWNPSYRGHDPKYFFIIQIGDLILRPDRKVGNPQGIFSWDETVALAKRAAEILGVTAEIPARIDQ